MSTALTSHATLRRRIAGVVVVAALAVAGATGAARADTTPTAPPATVSPVADRSATGVTADALPTAQIDGVVWSQAIVGNTVYAGGEFTNARPAGAAAGTQLTPRSNLLAYDLSTGKLSTTFAPVVNGTIKTVVASPDGSRIYIGGGFTAVNGQNRYRLAAFSTSNGALLGSFAPTVDATVNSLSVTSTTVYAGGIFGTANGNSRTRLAAFSAATGALLGWNPTADDTVDTILLTPSGKNVVIGGSFANLDGAAALGLGSVDAATGASVPFAVNQVVKDHGTQAAVLSLSTDGTAIYGTGYQYSGGNFEGTFSVEPDTGAINWLEDCHGDTYGSYAHAGQVYTVSHEHYCGNLGGFPESNPRSYRRTSAFTTQATGTLTYDASVGYANFSGRPSPSLINWFPDLTPGTYTKTDQAAWTVTGNDKYVVEGGEFLAVNGTLQQGLVRFAIPSLAPKKRGPVDTTSATTPTVTATSDRSATVGWPSNWDQDNDVLTYRLMRSGTSAPVYSTTGVSQFWNRPTLTFADTHLLPGTTYSYSVVASDPDGNTVRSASASVTTPGTPPTPTTATVTPSTTTPVSGQPVTADVAVTTADGKAADGSVDVTVDGGTPSALPLQDGHASLHTSFAATGRHTVAVDYAGDISFAASAGSATITVSPDRTAALASVAPTKPVTGQRLTVHSYVRTFAPGTTLATGSVTVAVDGAVKATTELTKALATTTLAGLRPGRHTITVRYAGDAHHAATSIAHTITVARGRSTATVTSSSKHPSTHTLVHFHATVRAVSPATGRPGGSVVYYVDGHRRATRSLSSGSTTYSVRLPKGRHHIKVTYVGSSTYSTVTSKTLTQTVH